MHQHQTTKQWILLPRVTSNRFFRSESPCILAFVFTTFFWRYGGKSSSTHTPHLQATIQWKTFLREPRHRFFHSKSPRMLGFFYTQYLRRYAQHYIQYFSTTMRDFSFFNKKEKFSHSKSKFASKNKNRHILMCVNALILFLYLWLI